MNTQGTGRVSRHFPWKIFLSSCLLLLILEPISALNSNRTCPESRVPSFHAEVGRAPRNVSVQLRNRNLTVEQFSNGNVTICRFYQLCRTSTGRTFVIKDSKVPSVSCRSAWFPVENRSAAVKARFVDHDLFLGGITKERTVIRFHMPHLLDDLIPVIAAHEVLIAASRGELAHLAGFTWEASEEKDQIKFRSTRERGNGVDGLVLMEERFGRLERTSLWGLSLLNAIGLRAEPEESFLGPQTTCFRSGITSFVSQMDPGPVQPLLTKILPYALRNVSRDPVPFRCGCEARILIIDREPAPRSTSRGPRKIVNLDALESKLHSLELCGAKPVVEVVRFGSESFENQVRIMQRANVVVSIHGAELANVVFVRPGSLVVELRPFAYRSSLFERLSRFFSLEYVALESAPDPDSMEPCMKIGSDPIGVLDPNQKRLMTLLREASRKSSARLQFPINLASSEPTEIRRARLCSRYQALWVDPDQIATHILTHTSQNCDCQAEIRSPIESWHILKGLGRWLGPWAPSILP